MLKLEYVEETEEHTLIKDFLKKIREKLLDLGYSSQDIHEELLKTVNRVFKFKVKDSKELNKVLMKKLSSEKMTRKIINQLIVELDLFFNSIHDNYESSVE